MKKLAKSSVLLIVLMVTSLIMMPSCKTGEGCLTNEKYGQEIDFSNTKRGKSSLFSKKKSKKMRESGQKKN